MSNALPNNTLIAQSKALETAVFSARFAHHAHLRGQGAVKHPHNAQTWHPFSTNSGTSGVLARPGAVFQAFATNTFAGNSESPIEVSFEHLGQLDNASEYNGTPPNTQEYIEVNPSNGDEVATLPATNVPMLINGSPDLTAAHIIEPGAVLWFAQSARLDIATGGSLNAVGTAEAGITFLGHNPSAGYWGGLNFESTDGENVLDYVEVGYGGSQGYANIYVSSTGSVSVTNCDIHDSSTYGIHVNGGAISPATAELLEAQNDFANNGAGTDHVLID